MATVDLQQAKHVFQLLILTAIADDDADGIEAFVIGELRREHPVLAALPDVSEIAVEIRERAAHIGIDNAIRACAAGLVDLYYRETAFVLCARVMRADGESEGDEATLLGTLQELFGFSPEDVVRLLATSA